MKFKKMLSLLAATAIAAGSFAAMAVTASAAVSIPDINTYSETTTFTFENEDLAAASIAKEGSKALNNGLYYYAGGTDNGYSITTAPDGISGYTKAYNGANGDTGKAVLVFKAGAAGKVSAKFSSTTAGDSMRINAGSNNDYSVSAANTIESTGEVTVAKDAIVYISSRNTKNRVSIYEITYTVTSDEPIEETKYTITIDDAIEHGSVSINGDLTEATAGTTINVTATPDTGYVLDKITVNGTDVTGTSFKMPAAAAVVSATFVEYVAPTLEELPLDKTITFDSDEYTGYIELGSSAVINNSTAEYGDVSYTKRLYFGGGYNSTNGRYASFTPAVSGTLQVIGESSSTTTERTLAIKQGDADEQTAAVSTATLCTYTVEAGVPVMIYSKGSGIGIYSIKLVESSVAPTGETYNKGYIFTTSNDVASKKYTTLTINVNDTANENKPGYATINVADQIATITGPAELTIFIKNIPAAYTVTSVELD